jgi:hypothetical protein
MDERVAIVKSFEEEFLDYGSWVKLRIVCGVFFFFIIAASSLIVFQMVEEDRLLMGYGCSLIFQKDTITRSNPEAAKSSSFLIPHLRHILILFAICTYDSVPASPSVVWSSSKYAVKVCLCNLVQLLITSFQ